MAVDLSKYTRVIEEDFESGLSEIWSTGPRRDQYITNSDYSVFLDGSELDANGDPLGIDPITVEDGKLSLGSGVIPEDKLDDVQALVEAAGQSSDDVAYYSSMIATDKTWSQTYGYIEIVAKVPTGKGHWPAFWLTAAGAEWPPEIDIAELYGKGIDAATAKDNTFNVAVHFDEYDEDLNQVYDIDIVNPYDLDENGEPTEAATRVVDGKEYGHFVQSIDADDLGLDIYSGYVTYAVEWTPTYISFLVGTDRSSLVEVYRTPTPEDVNSQLYLILNDQIGSNWDWNPVEGYDDQTFAEGNTLQIESVSIYTLTPEEAVYGSGPAALVVGDDTQQRLVGTPGDDFVVATTALEEIDLRGGDDMVFVTAAENASKIVTGFGADDTLVLEGWYFDGVEGALEALVQVGDDVWLPNGAYPTGPQTIIFRDTTVEEIAAADLVVRWSTTPDIWSSSQISGARVTNAAGTGFVYANAAGSKLSDGGSNAAGVVTIYGSDVGDLYFIYRPGTVLVEAEGGGVDTVYAYRSVTLAANLENLIGGVTTAGTALTGNDSDNRIVAGGDGQILTGEGGDDLLDFGTATTGQVVYGSGDGHDTIIGFGTGSTLVLSDIALPSWAALQARLTQLGSDVMLDLGTGQSVTFRDVDRADLTASNFSFPVGTTSLSGSGSDPYWQPNGTVSDAWLHGQADDALDGYTRVYAPAGGGNVGGTAGSDALFAGSGATTLRGLGGNDLLFSGDGNDSLDGGAGDDRLEAGDGVDLLYGRAGADRFVFVPETSGTDRIMDFGPKAGDRIDLSAFGSDIDDAGISLVKNGSAVDVVWEGPSGSVTVVTVEDTSVSSVQGALAWDALL